MNPKFSAAVWVIWLVSIAFVIMVTRNPLYLFILLLAARVVQFSCSPKEKNNTFFFGRFAVIILLFSVLFNLLLVHIGQTVLFSLPENLWLIGGDITLEAAVYGVINGLVLITLLAAFMAFNAIIPTSELVRLAPKSMTNVGLVLLIAMTYVPETRRQLLRIREAQEIRGHRLRGLRDWRPIVIPLLVGSMERSVDLAEIMVSRGYGSASTIKRSSRSQLGLLFGLLLVFTGSLLVFWAGDVGWVILVGGFLLILFILFWSGHKTDITRYRSKPWAGRDWLVIGFSILPFILVILPLPFVDRSTLFYTPYPSLELPVFDIWIGLGLMLFAVPAVIIK